MRLNLKTKLFEDLSLQECEELADWARHVVLEGTIPDPEPPGFLSGSEKLRRPYLRGPSTYSPSP
jgi:hypothetical protein